MKKFIKKLLETEVFRFLIAGGINTLVGGIIIPYIFKQIIANPTFTFLSISIDIPLTLGYLIWFSFAYIIQAKFVFKSDLVFKRYLIYPFSQIPNYALNQLFLYIFETALQLPSFISLVLAAICPIPIMFVIVRLIVKTKKQK
ncbi:MAG: GtrA family protein [Erysipelotrichales bacterium]|nr:GtrA family protein [Bacilli bacterium]MEA4820993.1 GtrA family protein [Erysipelotrichales bacterium]